MSPAGLGTKNNCAGEGQQQLSCQSVSFLVIYEQRLGKHVPTATNTRNRRIVGRDFSYAVRVVLKESWRLLLPRTSCYSSSHLSIFSNYLRGFNVKSLLSILIL
jgi:hypothetical protein